MPNRIFAFFFLLFWPLLAGAGTKNISSGNQQWLQYYNQTKLNAHWTWLTDGGYRWQDGFGESSQYIIRSGMGYLFASNFRLTIGLAHSGGFSEGRVSKAEFRPYQELVIKNQLGRFTLSHRYRVEERFVNTVRDGELQTPNSFNFRFRYALSLNIPLYRWPDKRALNLGLGDEIFINAGESIVYNVLDQNRFIISPNLQLSSGLNIALTWNSQFAGTSTPAAFKYTDVFWLQIKHKIDLE